MIFFLHIPSQYLDKSLRYFIINTRNNIFSYWPSATIHSNFIMEVLSSLKALSGTFVDCVIDKPIQFYS